MAGPIIRKYGFPNHEAIFGKRPLEHGAEAEAEDKKAADKPAEAKAAKPKSNAEPKKK